MMHRIFPLLLAVVSLLPLQASATPAEVGFEQAKQCIMQNDATFCHKVLTAESYPLFDRFMSYKLMPCLPTDFTYKSESTEAGFTVVKATQPAPDNRVRIIRLAFTAADTKLDVPASLRIGLGEDWQNKLQLAENIFLMLRANAGGNLTCDQLEGLVKK